MGRFFLAVFLVAVTQTKALTPTVAEAWRLYLIANIHAAGSNDPDFRYNDPRTYECKRLNWFMWQQAATTLVTTGNTPNENSIYLLSHIIARITNFSHVFANCDFTQLSPWASPTYDRVRVPTDFPENYEDDRFDFNAWNVTQATTFNGMFAGARLNPHQQFNDWDVSTATNFNNMFSRSTFNQDLRKWANHKPNLDLGSMFEDSTFNQNLSAWGTTFLNLRSANLNRTFASSGAVYNAGMYTQGKSLDAWADTAFASGFTGTADDTFQNDAADSNPCWYAANSGATSRVNTALCVAATTVTTTTTTGTTTTTTLLGAPTNMSLCSARGIDDDVFVGCAITGERIKGVVTVGVFAAASDLCTSSPPPPPPTDPLLLWAQGCCLNRQVCSIKCVEAACTCRTYLAAGSFTDMPNVSPGPKQVVLRVSCEATTMTTMTTTTTTTTTTERACLKGQFLNKPTNNCTACPDGEYQNLDGHTNGGCMRHHPCNATNMRRIFGGMTDKKHPSICIELGAHKDCPTRDVDGSNASYWHPANMSVFIDQVKFRRTPWHMQTQNETVSADMSKAVTAILANMTDPDLPWGGNVTNDAIQAAFLTEYNASITLPAQLEKAAVPFYALMCIEATPPCGSDNDLVYESAALTTTSDRVCDYCRPIIPTDANATNDGTTKFNASFGSADLDACPLANRTFAVNSTGGFMQECTLPSMVEGVRAADGAPLKNNRCCRVTETGPLIFNDTAETFEFLSDADERVITLTNMYEPEYQNGVAQCKHRAGNFHYKSTTTTATATTTTVTATTVTATTKTATTTTTTSTTTPVSHALRNRKIGYWVIGGLMLAVVAALLLGVCDRCHAATTGVSEAATVFGAWGRKHV